MLSLTKKSLGRASLCATGLVLVVFVFALAASLQEATGKRGDVAAGSGNSIQGYVATTLSPRRVARSTLTGLASTSLSSPIFLPDIEVWAKNLRSGVTSSHVVTNPQGYFLTPNHREGIYQICVSGTGYATQCDDHTINVTHPTELLD